MGQSQFLQDLWSVDAIWSVRWFPSVASTVPARGFEAEILRRFPESVIAGVQADRFRDATPEEDAADM